ncbi:hydrogenase 4 subunit B [Thermoplasmatales archaeon]|nr:hydrogenase 4 subunit B [Thermoplasmatales archaeon]
MYLLIPILLFASATILSIFNRRVGYAVDIAGSAVFIVLGFNPSNYSTYFILIASIVWILVSLFSMGYDRKYGSWLSSLISLTIMGMAIILSSESYLVFIAGWEIMSISSYAIIGLNSRDRTPPYVFMVFSEISTILIITGSVFAVFQQSPVAFSFLPLNSDIPLILIALGCVTKMGITPFMISEWLPIAHGNAPANASAMLSATMTLMGVFIIFRLIFLSPQSIAIGIFFLAIGSISVLFASIYAYISENMKMLGGFSTIENNGSILSALGLLLIVQQDTFRLFIILTVVMFSLAHSLGKTGLFMTVGSSRGEYFSQVSPGSNKWFTAGSVISMASLSGLFPTIGGLATWMLLESFFMEAYLGGFLGIIAIIVGSIIAIGEGMATGAMVKMTAFTRLYPRSGRKDSGGRSILLTGAIIVLLFLLSSLLFPDTLKGVIPGTLVFSGFTIESKLGIADFGLISPFYVAALIGAFSLLAYAIFRKPEGRNVPNWNGGRSEMTLYTSYAYSSNIRLMLRRVLRTHITTGSQPVSVVDIFWNTMIAVARTYRNFARRITLGIMNSSIGWYMLYMIVAFMIVLLISVYLI